MNYLAHAYLSFNDVDLLIGNMIADFIRGKQIEAYPERVQQGIHLHRQIDEFTDKHPVVKETKLLFRPYANRYDGSFLDVSYDYFLCNDMDREPDDGWDNFVQRCYVEIDKCLAWLPTDFGRMYEYMKRDNWLYNYRYSWRIKRSFEGLTRIVNYLPDDADVYRGFESNIEKLQESYDLFFPELESFVRERHLALIF